VGDRRGCRHRSSRSGPLAGLAVATSSIALAACGFAGDGAGSACEPASAPESELALMPPGLSFDAIGTVTDVRGDDLHTMVEAVAAKPLDELTVLIQDAVTAAGYRPGGMDNEGFEAEVFFTTAGGSVAAGQAVVRRSRACEGLWEIELALIDRDATPTRD
jgi:hypothetical protein